MHSTINLPYTNTNSGAATRLLVAIMALAMTAFTGVCWASTETILYTFGGSGDGKNPSAGLTPDSSGNFYGVTNVGGSHGDGAVFELSESGGTWTETILYSFGASGSDGKYPNGPLLYSSGDFYGTTEDGGANGYGTVFELSPSGSSWTESVLYSFCSSASCSDGAYPTGPLTMDSGGSLYGTTINGGATGGTRQNGVVYKLTMSGSSWSEAWTYDFLGGTDGGIPEGGVILDSSGSSANLYGTTSVGSGLYGTVFKLSTSGTLSLTTLYEFTGGSDGANPQGNLIWDSAGNLDGTTTYGGGSGYGVVFQLSPSGSSWTESVLHSFALSGAACPLAGVTLDPTSGDLYGDTSSYYGTAGIVFKLTPPGSGWSETTLHTFSGSPDGAVGVGNLILQSGKL